jgi:hypothetical protein
VTWALATIAVLLVAYAAVSRRLQLLSVSGAMFFNTLRRTYISIALLANGFDVKWVMSQVGHADSKMTLDVYAQLEQRVERSHGTSFDALLRGANDRLRAVDRATFGRPTRKSPTHHLPESARKRRRQHRYAGKKKVARPGLEPGTPRFSVVCSTN